MAKGEPKLDRIQFVRALAQSCRTLQTDARLSPDAVWNHLLKMSRERHEGLALIAPLICEYGQLELDFPGRPSQNVRKLINGLAVKEPHTWPVMHLMQFLCPQLAIRVLERCFEQVKLSLEKSSCLPVEFLATLEKAFIPSSLLGPVVGFFRTAIASKEGLVVFSAVSSSFGSEIQSLFADFAFADAQRNAIAYAYFLSKCGSFDIPFDKAKDFRVCLNALTVTHKAVSQLISDGFFDSDIAKPFIDAFSQGQSPAWIESYFSILSTLAARFPDEFYIKGLIRRLLGESTPALIKAQALRVLAYMSEEFQRAKLGAAVQILTELGKLNDSKTVTGVVSPIFVSLFKFSLPTGRAFVLDRLNWLCSGLTDGDVDLRFALAGDLCSLIRLGLDLSLCQPLFNFLIAMSSDHRTLSLVCGLGSAMTPMAAGTLFQRFSELQTDVAFVEGLADLVKHFAINPVKAHEIAMQIIKGERRCMFGYPLHLIQPVEPVYFQYLTSFIRRYPLESADICEAILNLVRSSPLSAVPWILRPIRKGIKARVAFDANGVGSFIDALIKVLSHLGVLDSDLLISIAITLKDILSETSFLTHEQAALATQRFLDILDDSKEASDSSLGHIQSSFASFVLCAYETWDTELLISYQCMNKLLDSVPPMLWSDATLESLCKWLKRGTLPQDTEISALQLLTRVVLETETQTNELFTVVREFLSCDPDVRRKVSEVFINSRALRQKFEALFAPQDDGHEE
jgi:hypothetical protein